MKKILIIVFVICFISLSYGQRNNNFRTYLGLNIEALQRLSGTGFVTKTGTGTFTVRTITGTTAQIGITYSDGVSGNPLISLADSIYISRAGKGSKFFLTGKTDANANATLLLSREGATNVQGLQLRHDAATACGYIDNLYNNNAGNIYFRTKTASTPVNALTILGSGNIGLGTISPVKQLSLETSGVMNSLYTNSLGYLIAEVSPTGQGLVLMDSASTSQALDIGRPSLWIQDGTQYSYHTYNNWNASNGIGLYTDDNTITARFTSDISSGDFFTIRTDDAGDEFTATEGTQNFFKVAPKINQSSTANYIGILLDVTPTGLGSGINKLMDLQVSSASKFTVLHSGNVGIGALTPNAALHVLSGTAPQVILTNVNKTDSVTFGVTAGDLTITPTGGDVYNVGAYNYMTDTSAVDDDFGAICTLVTTYRDGLRVTVKMGAINNTGACTFRINSLTATAIKTAGGDDPPNDYIEATRRIEIVFCDESTDYWQLLSPNANP